MKKIFILGVGAQKAGTSWFHTQLAKSDYVDMGFTKEYHVFDSIFSQECRFIRQNRINAILKHEKRGYSKKNLRRDNRYHRDVKLLSFIDNTENYFDYFDYLYLKDDRVEVVGDITPSYSMLDSEAYQYIRNGLEKRGFEIKVVFLMRDPVERVWSQLRMLRRNYNNVNNTAIKRLMSRLGLRRTEPHTKNIFYQMSENEALKEEYTSPDYELRTRYDRTIIELEKVFPKDNIYYGLYESLFTENDFNALKSFLEIDLTPDFEFKVNASPKSESIDSDLMEEIANYYADVYHFVSEKTNGRSNELWSGYRYLTK